MTDYLIVDGYNILHSWENLKKTMDKDLEHARDKLVDIMSNYQALTGVKVIVVFDAHHVRGGVGSRQEAPGVEVLYTIEGETADTVIERVTGKLVEGNRVTVATSDWAQQRIVFGKGAVRLSARELELEVKTRLKEVQGHFETLHNYDHKLSGYLKENIREILEKIRRQK